MITIDFYSYKGGVGRTFLASQIARCLAALGKKVVIADFDFDAPGIPAVFGKEIGSVSGGLFELVRKFHDVSNADKTNFEKQLKSFLINIEIKLRGEKNSGEIHILPSGRVNGPYWSNISSIKWMEIIASNERKSSFVYLVKELLQPTLKKMGIEYLLIDARAGINYYSSIARHVSEFHTMVICPNDDSRYALYSFLLPAINHNAENLERLVFVISRMPHELNEWKNAVFEDMEKFIKIELSDHILERTKFLKFHSDLDTHLYPQIRNFDEKYCEQDKVEIVQIHEDFLMILSALCPELNQEKGSLENQAHALWRKIYGYDFKITRENHLFGVLDSGVMQNSDDKNRNVAFKVETFLNMLNDFYKTLEAEFRDSVKTTKVMNKALFNAGEHCGDAFGKNLVITFNEKQICNFSRKVEEWCKFDTRAGFGLMSYNEKSKTLTVKNLFIQDLKISKAQDYTAFFTGYVLGVLKNLAGDNMLNTLQIIQINDNKKECFIPVYKEGVNLYEFEQCIGTSSGIKYRIEVNLENAFVL